MRERTVAAAQHHRNAHVHHWPTAEFLWNMPYTKDKNDDDDDAGSGGGGDGGDITEQLKF